MGRLHRRPSTRSRPEDTMRDLAHLIRLLISNHKLPPSSDTFRLSSIAIEVRKGPCLETACHSRAENKLDPAQHGGLTQQLGTHAFECKVRTDPCSDRSSQLRFNERGGLGLILPSRSIRRTRSRQERQRYLETFNLAIREESEAWSIVIGNSLREWGRLFCCRGRRCRPQRDILGGKRPRFGAQVCHDASETRSLVRPLWQARLGCSV